MGFKEEDLLSGEQIVYKTKLHVVLFLAPLVAYIIFISLIFMGYADIIVKKNHNIIFLFSIVLLLYSLYQYMIYKTSEIAVTNKRVFAKMGIFERTSFDIRLDKVESLSVDQEVMGRILGYGRVVITGTGGTPEQFSYISNPQELRHQVQKISS
jgi:uncharacterized membrane protein YdbT with pleckstrin-like domain